MRTKDVMWHYVQRALDEYFEKYGISEGTAELAKKTNKVNFHSVDKAILIKALELAVKDVG